MGDPGKSYPESDARSVAFERAGQLPVLLVTAHERVDARPPVEIAALLVHEAVHLWQGILAAMDQRGYAGNEIEAYAIQKLSMDLMAAYRDTRVTCCAA